jgi:hypothetical protein
MPEGGLELVTDDQQIKGLPNGKEKVVDDIFEDVFGEDPEAQRHLLGKGKPATDVRGKIKRKKSGTYSTVGFGCDFLGSA